MSESMIFSEAKLQASLGSNDARLKLKVLYIFLTSLEELKTMSTLLSDAKAQWETIRALAHKHRTPSESVGAEQLATELEFLEINIDSSHEAGAIRIIKNLPVTIRLTADAVQDTIQHLEATQ